MSGELKPCPFCGATDERLVQAFVRATDDFAYWSVECLDCGVEVADDESQDAADAAWNRRTTPSQGLDAATVERCAQAITAFDAADWCDCYPQARVLRDLLEARVLATDPHQHGGKGA